MLLCSKIFFKGGLRFKPHPEYMCQGGSMRRMNICKLVESIQEGIPDLHRESAFALIEDVQKSMIYLSSQLNNMYDRDSFDTLQDDFQIILHFLNRIFCEETTYHAGKLLEDSEMMISRQGDLA